MAPVCRILRLILCREFSLSLLLGCFGTVDLEEKTNIVRNRYVDLLLNDLGIKNHRKASQLQELAEAYKPWDYKGISQEWLAARKEKV